ncbi:apelin [Meleagris gallopavo]|uniref:Apelin n=1 Tax=Meleagris gallopavo TaxID=9103 RepID=A0A803XUU2_MELGA|nr:apelin [Meleagris gallopavo]
MLPSSWSIPTPRVGRASAHAVLPSPGPLGAGPDGMGPEDGLIRTLVRPRGARRGNVRRPGGWRRLRRPRPRLSHKGPMPF